MITILQSMLEFNPFFRKKPEEYLEMDLFKALREKHPEMLVPPSKCIKLEVDEKHAFDYNASKFKKFSMEDLKIQLS